MIKKFNQITVKVQVMNINFIKKESLIDSTHIKHIFPI